jgi:hypothetical protein
MPYEVSFTRAIAIVDRTAYINECCVGGDVVMEHLLPAVRRRFGEVQANQEDWGWFIWFRAGKVSLAIDIFTEDAEAGVFRLHLTARTRRWGVLDAVVDAPALEEVRRLVERELAGWTAAPCRVTRLDARYNPVEPAGQ